MFWYGNYKNSNSTKRIAVIPGDGIGPEVIGVGRRILEEVTLRDPGVRLSMDEFPWGSDYYRDCGAMMPSDAIEILKKYDAIYFGAVGDPALPLHVPVWGLILPIRQSFQQFVNLRPMNSMAGVSTPVGNGRHVNILMVRENTEGEYIGQGARLFPGTVKDTALQISVYSRDGVSRIIRYGFELARKLGMSCTSVTKSNALNYSGVFWDEIFDEIAHEYPDVTSHSILVDAAALYMVTSPERFQVVVTSNLFGDILSDLGAGLIGGLGLAPSANFNPNHESPALFEPVHGSAPDIAGRSVANPISAILSSAMMLGYLGYGDWEDRIFQAVSRALTDSRHHPRDLGGDASTDQVGDSVLRALEDGNGNM